MPASQHRRITDLIDIPPIFHGAGILSENEGQQFIPHAIE
jgi:hypothetical protein